MIFLDLIDFDMSESVYFKREVVVIPLLWAVTLIFLAMINAKNSTTSLV